MQISTGGPHILLFERDQQLAGLLMSELQLAGFSCHAARTAVEVFDAIARNPIRMVLVNLAQAAASRREFWVALDTQRRGRGVQVFTYHCTNIASYGPSSIEEQEDRTQTVLADMEIEGMPGIMNMVNAVRSQVVVSNTSAASRPAGSGNTGAFSAPGTQRTAPIPSVTSPRTNEAASSAQPSLSSSPGMPTPISSEAPAPAPMPQVAPTEVPRSFTSHSSDKIRAVIYPNQRSWNTSRDTGSGPFPSYRAEPQPDQEVTWSSRNQQSPTPPAADVVDRDRTGEGGDAPLPNESGLAQLSRMLEEHRTPTLEETVQEIRRISASHSSDLDEVTSQHPRVRLGDSSAMNSMSLRASPIQDLPNDRTSRTMPNGQSDTRMRRPNEPSLPVAPNYQPSPSTSILMSIATPAPPVPTAPLSMAPPVQATPPTTVTPPTLRPPSVSVIPPPSVLASAPSLQEREKPVRQEAPVAATVEKKVPAERNATDSLTERIQSIVSATLDTADESTGETTGTAPNNSLLLDIVQSFPPMPSPPPQQQVLNGRAARSLGSVLLEGHLVPQNRLEVAQGIQRMLRGVDMNYRLGEILLMFKLLTPDQLLAASLVSYGLITTVQISALGRIRQELHSIGLEYDLESLVILFRILTSEQMREVRAGFSS